VAIQFVVGVAGYGVGEQSGERAHPLTWVHELGNSPIDRSLEGEVRASMANSVIAMAASG
jgi:hypothetical protein